jgi:FAD/FMN-containing dehydrogenase/Fe-S oxidoreductase
MPVTLMPALERRLRTELAGEVLFDPFSRARYATDASHYQVMPVGIVVPRSTAELEPVIALARAEGVSVLARGAGTSQCGQAVNASLVVDCSRHLNRLLELDVAARRCVVEPGMVLDDLNRRLRPHGLWFPVDISTASRATIGGMAANNSCGARSLCYGTMRDNVVSIEAIMADGTSAHFGRLGSDLRELAPPLFDLARDLLAIGAREAEAITTHFPKLQRRVGGYNLDALVPNASPHNLAHVLVGSEGTLAFFTRLELQLSPVLGSRVVGACHFGRFYDAMAAAQHIVRLGPTAVELFDRTLIELAGDIAMFRPTLERFVKGAPEAILLVEFAQPDQLENERRLGRLHQLMGDLGLGWDQTGRQYGGVIDVVDPALQIAIADLRTSGLNVMMSMKEAGKPVSFVEDCAVPLEHLADYTDELTRIFHRHGTQGTWYAHASVGCLHVRPVLNLRLEKDVAAMRAIAEETFALVRAYKGSHSGEHGDGIVRSEFHEAMFGAGLLRAFEEVKDRFDPTGLFNPGRIVRAPKFDDRRYFRYGPHYLDASLSTVLDWSAYPGGAGGLQGAVEMCNNNGACRNTTGAVMCPSFRVTHQERDVTRGRANSLRLALSGQLGPDAFASDEMAATLALCVSCKACRRECPTGVDMARMKIEVLAARAATRGVSLFDRLVGWLPRYAPVAARVPWLLNLPDHVPGVRILAERLTGVSARRSLPRWRSDPFTEPAASGPRAGREVVLFVDTFNRYFEPETIEAARTVLAAAGYCAHLPKPVDGTTRPLCCGRTFLAIGAVERARQEAERVIAALAPFLARGVPLIGLEPSCLFGFRDEIPALITTSTAQRLAQQALTLEEFLVAEQQQGRLRLDLGPIAPRALLHGHCHQKAFGALASAQILLALVPELKVETVESSCCGMAGAFGFNRDTIDASLAMGELSLLPTVRGALADTLIVANGTSCRHQIRDGTGRVPVHVACVLARSLAAADTKRAGGIFSPPPQLPLNPCSP